MKQLELFPEMDVCEELAEHASELTSMFLMRDTLIKLANKNRDMSLERLKEAIAMIERRLTKTIH